jgi:hypothetical protein
MDSRFDGWCHSPDLITAQKRCLKINGCKAVTQDQYGFRESREITDEELKAYKEALRLANGVADF